jgi:hypothetical protein
VRFSLINFILIALIFSNVTKAEYYPEPSVYTADKNIDFYQKKYGYNTQSRCTGGDMCLLAGEEATCAYSYATGGAQSKVQVCEMKTIKRKDGTLEDVSKKKYNLVTGVISPTGQFGKIPENEILLATRGMFSSQGKVKKFVQASTPPEPETPSDFAVPGLEGGVCLPGKECYATVDPCLSSGAISALICAERKAHLFDSLSMHLDREEIGKAFDESFAPTCDNFISSTGELGVRGKKTLDAIKKVDPGCFNGEEGSIDVGVLCPNFKNFSQDQKDYFWVWTYASMAQEETTCGVRLHNKYAANGDASGLFQMENKYYRKIRDPRYCPHTNVNINNETIQFECTTSILVDTTCKKGWSLDSKHGYWAELHGIVPYFTKMKKKKKLVKIKPEISWHIMKFPGCKDK